MLCRNLEIISDKEFEEVNLSIDETILLVDGGFDKTTICEEQHGGMIASLDAEEKISETTGRKFSNPRQQQESLILKGNLEGVRECSIFV